MSPYRVSSIMGGVETHLGAYQVVSCGDMAPERAADGFLQQGVGLWVCVRWGWRCCGWGNSPVGVLSSDMALEKAADGVLQRGVGGWVCVRGVRVLWGCCGCENSPAGGLHGDVAVEAAADGVLVPVKHYGAGKLTWHLFLSRLPCNWAHNGC